MRSRDELHPLLREGFPRLLLTEFEVESPQDKNYNCIAWTVGEDNRRWWPDPTGQWFWPDGIPREDSVDAFIQMFERFGYEVTQNAEVESGWEKIAIYYTDDGVVKHAAKQLPSGLWSSKLGEAEDIKHRVHGLLGPLYGTQIKFMKRPTEGE